MPHTITSRGGIKSVIFVSLLSFSNRCARTKAGRIFGAPIRLLYRIFSRNIMHVEIWDTTSIGSGLVLWHGAHGSVINPNTKIGENFNLRQNTTIGSSSFTDSSLCPNIGDNVQVGPNCTILGKISIGNNAVIGGGSVVVKDVPANAVVAGNPVKIIRVLNNANGGGKQLYIMWFNRSIRNTVCLYFSWIPQVYSFYLSLFRKVLLWDKISFHK